jgi:hypothetical protein
MVGDQVGGVVYMVGDQVGGAVHMVGDQVGGRGVYGRLPPLRSW